MRTYTAVTEKCVDTGLYVGYVPGVPCAHSQAATLDELSANLREVLELIAEEGEPQPERHFMGTHTLTIGMQMVVGRRYPCILAVTSHRFSCARSPQTSA